MDFQKFQNIRLTHIVQNNAKFHENNSLNKQRFSATNRDCREFFKRTKSAEHKVFLRRNCELTAKFVQCQPQINR